RIGIRIEELWGEPVDIEWAQAGGCFFIVQARPITGLRAETPALLVWNDSLPGDYLLTSANLRDAIPDVMTRCTWSIVERFMEDAMVAGMLGGHRLYGNIGGRFYMNLSVLESVAEAFWARKKLAESSEQVFGRMPSGVEVPLVPISR